MDSSIQRLVEILQLKPHPEGGFYRETYRSDLHVAHPRIPTGSERSGGTAIYFLLPADDFSAFHRVRWTDEIWHVYSGDPLELHLIHADGRYEHRIVASDLSLGEPVTIVEAGCWQAARVKAGGAWTLGGCTVSPGFEFDDFEMPSAGRLVNRYPQHETIIRELTKH